MSWRPRVDGCQELFSEGWLETGTWNCHRSDKTTQKCTLVASVQGVVENKWMEGEKEGQGLRTKSRHSLLGNLETALSMSYIAQFLQGLTAEALWTPPHEGSRWGWGICLSSHKAMPALSGTTASLSCWWLVSKFKLWYDTQMCGHQIFSHIFGNLGPLSCPL